MFKKILTIWAILFITLTSASYVYAQRGIDPSLKPENAPDVPAAGPGSEEECTSRGGKWDATYELCTGFEAEPINAFFQVISGALLMLSGGIAVIVITIGGVLYITSHGNQQQMELAKNTLVYGIMGIIVIIFSFFIIRFVLQVVTGNA